MTREIFEVEAPYKFTFPIEKAETRADGLYLIGVASGPEVDIQNERVHPTLIQKWADQINDGELPPVIYRDWHNKNSSTADLGVVTKAWVDDSDHLVIETRLDEDNPTASYIHKSIKKGKQYGMSVFGKVHRFADEFDQTLKRTVRTFYDATLEEVSNTTRPVYTPSFGTVLSKAVDEAEAAVSAAGETQVGEETETKVEKTTEVATTATTDTGAATAPDTNKAPVDAGTDSTTEVEKAITTDTKKDEKALAEIVKTIGILNQKLQAAGLSTVDDPSADLKTETTVTKSEVEKSDAESTSAPDVVNLQKSVNDLTAIVAALADKIPDGSAPGVLSKSESVDPLQELKDEKDPTERLRLSLAILHGEVKR